MREQLTMGLIVAILTGGGFAMLSTIEGAVGRALGAINASLLEHLIAGVISVVAIAVVTYQGGLGWLTVRPILPMATLGAVVVLIAVAGVGYALPRTGVAAGNMTMVLGQMALAVLIDSQGLAGYERIPLSVPRIAGLLLIAVGTYLVLPKSG
jgi:transporter family-2 protein